MIPCSFDESNQVLGRPSDMKDEECDPLSVFSGGMMLENGVVPVYVSCYKMTKEEKEEFDRTGRVWLIVMGYTHPPLKLQAFSPFQRSE